MHDLGGVYRDDGQLDKALELSEQVFEIRMRKLKPGHGKTVNSMAHLRLYLVEAGKTDQGLPLLEQSVEWFPKFLQPVPHLADFGNG